MSNPHDPRSRAYPGIAVTVGTGEDDEDRDALYGMARSVDPEATAHETGIGWGGDSHAVTIVFDGLKWIGGVGGGVLIMGSAAGVALRPLVQLIRKLRTDGERPHLSLGAATALCLVDLQHRLGSDAGDVALVRAYDLVASHGAPMGFSGAGDPYVVIFARHDCSWLYLVSSVGEIFHFTEGGPLPADPYAFGFDGPSDWRPDERPHLYDRHEETDVYDQRQDFDE